MVITVITKHRDKEDFEKHHAIVPPWFEIVPDTSSPFSPMGFHAADNAVLSGRLFYPDNTKLGLRRIIANLAEDSIDIITFGRWRLENPDLVEDNAKVELSRCQSIINHYKSQVIKSDKGLVIVAHQGVFVLNAIPDANRRAMQYSNVSDIDKFIALCMIPNVIGHDAFLDFANVFLNRKKVDGNFVFSTFRDFLAKWHLLKYDGIVNGSEN